MRPSDTITNTEPGPAQALRPVEQMTGEECMAELERDGDIHRRRALVGARRLLLEMERQGVTGKLEGDVQAGRVRRWRYPRSLEVS